MTSAIDATKPLAGRATTQSVRDNFTTAASEITALQAGVIPGLSSTSSPLEGDGLVGVKLVATGAVGRTQHDKNADTVHLFDFIDDLVIPHASIVSGANTTALTTQFQAALDHVYLTGVGQIELILPPGVILTGRLTYKGQRIRGAGEGRTFIQGLPKQDVFYAPDPTIAESGGLTNLADYMLLTGFTVTVDNSLALTLPPTASPDFNRPVFPTIAWASTTAFTESQWTVTSTGKIYICLVGGTTSSSEPTHTTGYALDGTVKWGYIAPAQIYLGNAAFAFPIYDGSVSHGYLERALFKNVRVENTGTQHANSAVALFSQRAMYDCTLESFTSRYQTYGICNVPPTTNFASVEFAPDASTFNKVVVNSVYPLFMYNAFVQKWDTTQFYASTSGDRNLWLLQYKSLARNVTEDCTFDSFYCEGNNATTGVMGHVMGKGHVFNGGAMKLDYAAGFIAWWANGCSVDTTLNEIDTAGNQALKIYGHMNRFRLQTKSFDNHTLDQGYGNVSEVTDCDSFQLISDRTVLLGGNNRPPALAKNGTFGLRGMPDTTFNNEDDLFITPADILWLAVSPQPTITNDSTLESGMYVTTPTSTNGGVDWNTLQRKTPSVGDRVPKEKLRVYVKARATSGSRTQVVSFRTGAGSTSRGSTTMSLTTAWVVYFFDADVDLAAAGDRIRMNFNGTSDSGTVDIAWIILRPIPVDIVPRVGADVGNLAKTLTIGTDEMTQVWNTAISADRAVTLATTGAYNGAKFRIVRTALATGAFNINVGTGPLKAMGTAGSFCEVEYNGTAWFLSAYGLL